MGKPYSIDLRERVQAKVESGQSRRGAVRRYDVSASFVVKLADRILRTGSAEPARQGRPSGGGKLARIWRLCSVDRCRAGHHDAGTSGQIESREGCDSASASLSRVLLKAGLSSKKTLLASEAERGRAPGA